MTISSINQIYQSISWFIALFELILGLYILVLNPWHPSNRHVSTLLILTSSITFLLSLISGATSTSELQIPILLPAVLIPAVQPWILITTIIVLRPDWYKGRWKNILLGLYLLASLPALFTLIDGFLHTGLWFTGIPTNYQVGMYIPIALYTGGSLGAPLRIISIDLIPILAFVLLGFILFDKKTNPDIKRLSILLLIGQAIAIAVQFGLRSSLLGIHTLITSTLYALMYALAAFSQMISERGARRGSLRTRLIAIILIIALPIIYAVVSNLGAQAGAIVENNAIEQLVAISQATRTDISLWITANDRALEQLAGSQEIASQRPDWQKPALEKYARLYPYVSQVSVIDLNGINVARSDTNPLQDYRQNQWFKDILQGAPVAYEIGISTTSDKPVLVIAKPIDNTQGELEGMVMVETELTEVNKITTLQVGKSGYVFAVDSAYHAIISPEVTNSSTIIGMDQYPLIKAYVASKGKIRGFYTFTDENGKIWRSYTSKLDNGWIVVVQQPESELKEPLRIYQKISWITLIAAAILLAAITWFSIGQTLLPIRKLTSTATAIAEGDLNRIAPVESTDEIGQLSIAFNSMTGQLKELITGLEKRVAERTGALGRKAIQLQTAAQVASEAAAIQNMNSLLGQAVRLISERFSFYHTGIFLIDEAGEYAILQAASSEGGQRMLVKSHKLQIGKVGIVGNVASTAKPRIALDVGADAVFFNNPDLPLTKSEMAVPMKARGQVIGVLDVQSTQAGAFTEEDVEVIQILADQIALAIYNTRLLEASQEALEELQSQYRQSTREAWREQQKLGTTGYVYNRLEVKPLYVEQISESHDDVASQSDPMRITIPLAVRSQTIGTVSLKREAGQEPWTEEEKALAREAAEQISQSLENARLLEEIQRRIRQERIISEITAKVRASTNVDVILQTAIQELAEKLRLRHGAIQIRGGNGGKGNG